MSYLHGDQFVFPLFHLFLKGLDVGRAVHRLSFQDVVVQHDLHELVTSRKFFRNANGSNFDTTDC